ncbi:related to multidrug resistant protein [Ustilago trichophora]|uniref:Related to multidrug resistant protein n=1 Tax=Ustilago trichophora TaxID=86804 RepID=A0A5C3EFE1_9BASI|nr:related to multidrug resistant protein [Ustilago trichophora]
MASHSTTSSCIQPQPAAAAAPPQQPLDPATEGTATPYTVMSGEASSSRTRTDSLSSHHTSPISRSTIVDDNKIQTQHDSPIKTTSSTSPSKIVSNPVPAELHPASSEHIPATHSSSAENDLEKAPQADPALLQSQAEDDVIWVEFPPGDPENPFNFSKTRKWCITILGVLFTAEVAATASAYVPGIPSMERDLNIKNHELSLLGIAIYPLGFALPPLVLAPLSEVFGRNPMYLVCHLCYTVLFVGLGFADNAATVIILRFLSGMFGSTGSTMVGGSISDIWSSKERGQPMALFATGAIFGTGIGPVWAGWVENNRRLGWRWIQYIQAIYTGFILILLLLFLRETRGSIILTRRAAKLRKTTGDSRYKARAELETASISVLIKNSLTRPLIFLVKEPIVTFFSLWIAFTWGFMYMLLSSVGLITAQHSFTPGETGLVFIAIAGAGILGNLMNPMQEYLYRKNFPRRGPEARLYFACIGAITFPVGCFIYAWTSFPHTSIAGPVVGIVVLMTAIYHIYLAVFNYLADSYLTYASSALAAQSFARNLFGFIFPLIVEKMYHGLGYQWASTLSAFLGALLGVVPFVLFFYGKKIRAKSKISQALQRQFEEQEAKEKP